MTTSIYSMNSPVAASSFLLERGQPKSYAVHAPSGAQFNLHFCGDCGSALWVEGPTFSDMKVLKSGILDGEDAMELESVKLKAEQWTVRRPGWLCAVEAASQTDGQMLKGQEELEKSQSDIC